MKVGDNMASEKYRCFRCGSSRFLSDFYGVGDWTLPYVPICKQCVQELYEEYVNESNNPYDALYKFCGNFGLYYDTGLAKGVISAALERDADAYKIIGAYLKGLTLVQYRGKTFLDSDVLGKKGLEDDAETQALINAARSNIGKWGAGYSKEDYARLNELYSMWSSGTPQETVTQVSLTKDLCKIDLQLEKSTTGGKDTKALLDQKQSLIKSLAIDPQTLLKNRQDNEAIECFGSWIAEIEKTSPAEYLDDPDVYFDVNGIEKYWDNHIKRPLKNLLLGTKDFPDVNIEE
jgi:hypothetical protein